MQFWLTNLEGYIIAQALDDFDDFQLPSAISRIPLYSLIKKILEGLDIFCKGGYYFPHIKDIDRSKRFTIELSLAEIDYITKAFEYQGDIYKGTVYEKVFTKLCNSMKDKVRNTPYGAFKKTVENEADFEKVFGQEDDLLDKNVPESKGVVFFGRKKEGSILRGLRLKTPEEMIRYGCSPSLVEAMSRIKRRSHK